MVRFRPVLREHGLTEQQWRVIRTLADTGDVDAGELARRSFLLAPSLTRILQHLVKEGLVTRASDRNDQRRSVLTLSAKGQKVFDTVGPDSEQRYAEIEEEFGRDRLHALYELLTAFHTTLDPDSLQSD